MDTFEIGSSSQLQREETLTDEIFDDALFVQNSSTEKTVAPYA